mmetsp:Transcript_26994/g.27236  ORF Transcript_26994/g.27236 Transcript_26994/m.27236 type:complete len:159 (+) Transcript_26994:108-584(+)|eukprot:CAMPEP_0182434172 /NCGR_PEP_ID=MMETSP1167-20130531/68165_1 /TAXON_ID=2988 /ORGANISM="Mallomonas Sp, Strain CCMP3275" /LENGTH=158 /DNA_ID=CAMNT_0024623733 /DNA_START=86 /DNA_END=565 /DNA_ORIENTATION=+
MRINEETSDGFPSNNNTMSGSGSQEATNTIYQSKDSTETSVETAVTVDLHEVGNVVNHYMNEYSRVIEHLYQEVCDATQISFETREALGDIATDLEVKNSVIEESIRSALQYVNNLNDLVKSATAPIQLCKAEGDLASDNLQNGQTEDDFNSTIVSEE